MLDDPFEFVFTNIMFYYPAFRPEDDARYNYGHLQETLAKVVPRRALGTSPQPPASGSCRR